MTEFRLEPPPQIKPHDEIVAELDNVYIGQGKKACAERYRELTGGSEARSIEVATLFQLKNLQITEDR